MPASGINETYACPNCQYGHFSRNNGYRKVIIGDEANQLDEWRNGEANSSGGANDTNE
jgi:hypothetical protein